MQATVGDRLHVHGNTVGQAEQRIRQAESPLSRLGPRELEVLKEMAEGKTNAAIGVVLI